MAQAAYAYKQTAYLEPVRQRPEQDNNKRPELKVVTGRATVAQNSSLPMLKRLFTVSLVAIIALGLILMLRVVVTQATMTMLTGTETVNEAIADERMRGTELEVEYSKATSPTSIQTSAAADLGMVADDQVEYIRIDPQG